MTDDDHTLLLRGLLAAHTDLDALPHAGPAGRVMLAAAVAGNGCSDDAIAHAASMPVVAVQEILPSMLERCLHVPALLTAKANMVPGYAVTFTGIRLTGEANGGSGRRATTSPGRDGRSGWGRKRVPLGGPAIHPQRRHDCLADSQRDGECGH